MFLQVVESNRCDVLLGDLGALEKSSQSRVSRRFKAASIMGNVIFTICNSFFACGRSFL